MQKSFLTNFLAFIVIFLGLFLENELILMMGLFAFSGALTNWIAVHMLFNKVPLLYGSGVVEVKFEAFKEGIKNLLMEQFFTPENIEKFLEKEGQEGVDLEPLLEKTDFSPAFESLKQVIMDSPFGNMLNMFGGVSAVEPLKEPFIQKMRRALADISQTETFKATIVKSLQKSDMNRDMHTQIANVVDARLEELTPQMVKAIVQKMIKEHLGWLVVWGGVFGAVIGAVSTLI
jgi:uncharacterized membrane protein YheB (UPF0754 family)